MPRDAGSASTDDRSVVIAGFSTRALVESALAAGYRVASVDAFADLDNAATPALALRTPHAAIARYSPLGIARAARALPARFAAYVASFENHPDAVRTLARGRQLLGNPPRVLSHARAPDTLHGVLHRHGFPVPAFRLRRHRLPDRTAWLAKPYASGGGHGITRWRHGTTLNATHFLQQRIRGTPGSLVFAADGKSAVPFAFSRQLIGQREFGASGFQYCGSILVPRRTATFARSDALFDTACRIADVLARTLHLVGVNGIDFIAREGTPFVTELNPRYTASMELAERAFDFSVFSAHASGSAGVAAHFDLAGVRSDTTTDVLGKAIIFAKRTVTLGDTRPWLDDFSIRDVPHPGERIPRGSPVCTIFARGANETACRDALVRRARKLYEEIGGSGRKSA